MTRVEHMRAKSNDGYTYSSTDSETTHSPSYGNAKQIEWRKYVTNNHNNNTQCVWNRAMLRESKSNEQC